ncbi:response regulator [Mucilaginibacter hurinus]|uniref:Response regulator n=1 Tax=Mucilaginibacter hurinus TaxID=2201324 RepID=A0A367GW46_9SPHI|nr:response regulator [Mucilaginibacter hurinus]
MMRRILAVDDNSEILEILQLILEDYGYTVDTLTDGHYLFDRIKESMPDLILLDVMLGDMDGRELCKEVKSGEFTHGIPVVLLSATYEMTENDKMKYGNPNAFIAKPFDINVLIDVVERQLAA